MRWSIVRYTVPTKKAGDFELPILGFGTWTIGGRDDPDYSQDEQDIVAIREAIKAGITHIDTAAVYSAGHAEELVGKVIKEFDSSQLLITSKAPSASLGYDDVISACKGSLARLGITKLNLYLIHGPNHRFPIKGTMRAMDTLLENEMTRCIGVSNFTGKQILEAQSCSKYKIVTNQVHYNLLAREFEEDGTLEYCRKNEILVTAFRPIEKGEILVRPGHELLEEIAKKYNKNPIQVAINWVMNQPNTVTVFKAANLDHLQEDLGALGWQMSAGDQQRLEKEYPRGQTHIYSYDYNLLRKKLRGKSS